MPNSLPEKNDNFLNQDKTLILMYSAEDDHSLFVSCHDGTLLTVPKNRNIPQPFPDQPTQPLTPVFRLLALAFVGLAPAGLGALVLAPLAGLWALVILITRPLSPGDQKRVMIVCGIAVILLGIAIPISKLFLASLSK
jgi:hypothetical protein